MNKTIVDCKGVYVMKYTGSNSSCYNAKEEGKRGVKKTVCDENTVPFTLLARQ